MVAGIVLLGLALGSAACPVVSDISKSPDGRTTAATLWKDLPQDYRNPELFPVAIVILHNGRYERELHGNGAYIWRWIFWNGGKQIAADTSKLHFVEVYSLIEVGTGRLIDSIAPQQEPRVEDWEQAILHTGASTGSADQTRVNCRFRAPRSSVQRAVPNRK